MNSCLSEEVFVSILFLKDNLMGAEFKIERRLRLMPVSFQHLERVPPFSLCSRGS